MVQVNFGQHFQDEMCQKAIALLVLKECMSVHLMDFHKKVFFDRIRTQLVLWMHWSLFLCKTNKNYLRTRACPQMIVHLARQDPCWWRVESLRVFAGSVLQTIPTKWWSAPPWQIVSSQERAVFGVFSCFFFFAAAGCCLVGNLVAPLLDGLNDL